MRLTCLALASLLTSACATAPEVLNFEIVPVPASVETDPMISRGDTADDPAIWVHPDAVERSLILGTDKDQGLYVYDLNGKQQQFLGVGAINNVDLRGNLAVASNDQVNGLSWFSIDPGTASISHIGDSAVQTIEPYGVCAGLVDGLYHAGVTYKDGRIELWQVPANADKMITPALVRTVQLASQLEGCVFDDAAARLFIGEEARGVWSLDLRSAESAPVLVDEVAGQNGLIADTEGVSLWLGPDGTGYLVVSAQEGDRYVVYDRAPPHMPRGIFEITQSSDGSIDRVTHTDGIDVTSAALPGYPRGLLVVQDDGNPQSGVNQNFKLVDWAAIEAALGLTAE